MHIGPHPARLLKPGARRFDYPATQVGTTPDGLVTVWYDPSLGAAGGIMAQSVLSAAPKAYADCKTWFALPGSPVNLLIVPLSGSGDGTGGAYHYGCDFITGGDLYIDYARNNLAMEIGLFVAELTECFMGAQGRGWDCGGSNGEALSRALAELSSGGPGGALRAFATAPAWSRAGEPDWVDATENTDQDSVATGCGMAYISWMMSQGYSAAQITQAAGSTLATNYQGLTGRTTAWVDFTAALKGKSIVDDDPFGGIAKNPQPAPAPSPPPPPPPPPSPPPPPPPTPPPPSPPPPTPGPPPPPPTGVTKAQAIAAFTALVQASTLP